MKYLPRIEIREGKSIEWEEVRDYEGLYLVSTMGELQNALTGEIQTRARQFTLHHPKRKTKRVSIPRLILETFYGHPTSSFGYLKGRMAWHKNGNDWDHRLENLEWISRSELAKRTWLFGSHAGRVKRIENLKKHARKTKTHCVRGHLRTAENLWKVGLGGRYGSCKECSRIALKAYQKRQREKKLLLR